MQPRSLTTDVERHFAQLGAALDVFLAPGRGDPLDRQASWTAALDRDLPEHGVGAPDGGGFRDMPDMKPEDFIWPDLESPEAAAIWGADPMLSRREALDVALAAELAGHDYYKSVLDSTDDPEIKILAAEFVHEEAEHVAELRKWIAAADAGQSATAK